MTLNFTFHLEENSMMFVDELFSHEQFSRVFPKFHNFLPETKVFSSSVPQENPQYGPFHLFSEQVPVCGIIGIGLFQRKSRKCRKSIWKNSFNSWRLGRLAGQCKLKLLWVRIIYLLQNPLGLDFSTVISTGRWQIHAQLRLQQKAVWAVKSAIKKIRSCWIIFKKTSKINQKTYFTPLDVYSKHLKV